MSEGSQNLKDLEQWISRYPSVAVAVSGGIDSAVLAFAANEARGKDSIALIAKSEFLPARDLDDALRLLEEIGMPYKLVEAHPLEVPEVARNEDDRCYFCKRELFGRLLDAARDAFEGEGFVLLDGTNYDDLHEDRPGLRALEELGVESPMAKMRLTKDDVRQMAKSAGIRIWEKPSSACLATRMRPGVPIDPARLGMVDAAEEAVRALGFSQVRVRDMEGAAVVQLLPIELAGMDEFAEGKIREAVRGAGFEDARVDERGYGTDRRDARMDVGNDSFVDIGFASVDTGRLSRQGFSEVIYGEGKTAEQIVSIIQALANAGQRDLLITRLSPEKAEAVSDGIDIEYNEMARCAIVGSRPEPSGMGYVLVVTAGTSDVPVAEEAAITCEMLGNEVVRAYDVGVAGIHRTLAHESEIREASTIIVIAGMEGALASVVGGMAECPVIAVPTSVGYGASFGGLAALLAMLNSCASGVAVMNIDNGFGAACFASKVNHPRKTGEASDA